MSTNERSFWSTTSGLVTGLAGTLTAVVGLITAGIQLGWFGSDDAGDKVNATATTTTLAPSTGLTGTTTRSAVGGSTATTSLSQLVANQEKLTFQPLGPKEQTVSVRNTGTSALSLRPPFVDGVDKAQFTAVDLTCGTRLDAGRTCDVKVTYLATKAGKATARLVIEPTVGIAAEIQLEVASLLG